MTFANSAPIYDVDGKTPLAGPGFLAELYASALGGALAPIDSSITPFLMAAPGYFFDAIDVEVPGTVDGGSAMVQVVAWRATDGGTFAEANHPGGHVGKSNVFTVLGLGGNLPQPGAPLTGMQSFSLYVVVPEPCVSALALVGLFGMGAWRRSGRRRSPSSR